jgi:hypothetical protein
MKQPQKWVLRNAAFALNTAVFFSVSSLELVPVVSAQPLTCPYWEPRWLLSRSEMLSPATMSYTFGPSPYMICEVWVPRSSMASSVLEPSTISVSKYQLSYRILLPAHIFSRPRRLSEKLLRSNQFVLISLVSVVKLEVKNTCHLWFCNLEL